jgi:tetratricopeptide (TPR) repeat protein
MLKKKDINSYLSLGKVFAAKGNGTDALKNFSSALEIDSKNPEALTQKAKIYILINNSNAGIELLNKAITFDSSYAPAFYELAESYASLKNYPKAAENYAKYIDASESTIEKQKRYAQILYINKEYPKAISILEQVIKKESEISSSLRIIAYSYLRMEDTEKSKSYFEKLFSLSNVEFQPTDYENYGDLLNKTGEDSLAIVYYGKVVDLDSTQKELYGKISVLYFKNKKWDGVVSSLEKKGKLTAQEYFDLGKANMFIGDKALAEVTEILNSSVKLTDDQKWNSVRPALLYYQGDIRDAKNDPTKIEEAIAKVSQTIEQSMIKDQKIKWPFVKLSWLSDVRSKIKLDYAKADTAFTTLIKKVPDLAVAHFWQARVKANFDPESKLGLAKPYYEHFIESAKAEKDKFKKELIESYQYLGYYYYLQEDNAKSKVYWQEVLNLDPENKQATEVLKQLK